jgi:uncharacterized protein YndB with AHSA1/START domain
MRYLFILGGIVVLVVVAVVVTGSFLPIAHHATREASYKVPAANVYALITNVRAFPEWRPSVKKVEILPTVNGHSQFREIGRNGSILYEIDSVVPSRRLVTRIADRSLPFGGRWTFELTPNGSSTTLRITEDGEVYNPIFRFVSRFVFGHSAGIDQYLGDVGRRLAKSA